jgi:hypothetical protein
LVIEGWYHPSFYFPVNRGGGYDLS